MCGDGVGGPGRLAWGMGTEDSALHLNLEISIFETKANSEIEMPSLVPRQAIHLPWPRLSLCFCPYVNQPAPQTGYRCHNGLPVLEELPSAWFRRKSWPLLYLLLLALELNHPLVLKIKEPVAELCSFKLCVLKYSLVLTVTKNDPG